MKYGVTVNLTPVMALIKGGQSVILVHGDLFVKVTTCVPYGEKTYEDSANREALFQTKAKSIVDGLKTPFRVSVPMVYGVVKNVLVTEKVNGITFEKLCRRDINKARELVPSLALAVRELENHVIFHNDMYQDNVMWDEVSQTIWIVDFGMAYSMKEWDGDQMDEFAF